MVNRDLKRARALLKAARDLFSMGDLAGVSGIAYQAFESAVMAINKKSGMDKPSHIFRREKAKELVSKFKDKIDFLWELRNIDFYGDTSPGATRELNKEQVGEALDVVNEIIDELERLLIEELVKK